MSDARKFRFVSPGIFLNEVDRSQIPAAPIGIGPVIIGRAERGPGMIPTRVGSFTEFVEKFGNPIPGRGGTLDVWREGNYASPTYAAYAAQAYLRAGVGPVTFLRLMGTQHVDATVPGYAGWKTVNTPDPDVASNGGAYGLFVFASASATTAATTNIGTLAAVWYINEGGAIVLSGNATDGQPTTGAATIIHSDASGQFKAYIYNSSRATEENKTFSLAEGSSNFIRKVFNTNPQRVSSIEDSVNQKSYWLGETYERYLTDQSLNGSAVRYGAILALASGSQEAGNHEKDYAYRDAHTGWFFGQGLSADTSSYTYDGQQKLFKFVGINGHGSWLQNNIKISIANVKYSGNEYVPYGTFDIVVRKASDSDLRPVILERFSACTLDPASMNYIGVKIGDMQQTWDNTEKRYREYGDYPNRSEYIRVVVNDVVGNGAANPVLLPFGVYGPPKFPSWTFTLSASGDLGHASTTSYVLGSSSIPENNSQGAALTATHLWAGATSQTLYATDSIGYGTASIIYPGVAVRHSASDDGSNPLSTAYFGLQTDKSRGSGVYDPGYSDYLRAFGRQVISDANWGDSFSENGFPSGTGLDYQWIFTLDEVTALTGSTFTSARPTTGISDAHWTSGSYVAGTSWNASASLGTGANYQNILDSQINRFTSPMYGGADGLDIKERDPFRNTAIGSVETTDYVYYTLRRAIDTIADAEVIAMNAACLPGITNESVTKYLIDTCEARADALAVIDLKGCFQPRHESANSLSDRQGNLDTVLTNMKARNLNSSYGCAYYPWVKVRDDLNGSFVDMPPSVVALGVLANTERSADVWFAPAGFRRGGLSFGAGGLPVVGVETKLTSRNRDDLYDININPIASFPAEGIVVFGQKTLQATRSALDRINVRRLMIFVKRGISQIASTTLFQPNVEATWNSFKARANRFLGAVKVRFGVDDFRIILDETTTTPDLVDRNIMYAKIFIKPTRAIEFIAIDFIITRSGASFED